MIVKPKSAKWPGCVKSAKSEQTQPRRPNHQAKCSSKECRQNCDSRSGGRRKFFQEFAVKHCIEGVEMEFGAGHWPERRREFVRLPFSFRSDDDDFVPEKFAGPVIVLPIFGHEDFEDRMRTETRSRRKAHKVLGQIIGNQLGMSSL